MSDLQRIEGRLSAAGRRFAVVASRFNDAVVDRLVDGAVDCLLRHGAAEGDVTIVRVPGAWELPLALEKLAKTGRYDGLVALGAVIRGETSHFDFVAGEASSGIAAAARRSGLPVGMGLLTCETSEQARERAGGKAGNKGWEAALAAIEMADLFAQIEESSP